VTSTTSDRDKAFAEAWQHVDRASTLLGSLAKTWNAACSDVFSAHIVTMPSGIGEITVDLDFDDPTRRLLNDTGREIGTMLRQALAAGVVALARLVSGVLVLPDPTVVNFPLADTLDDFLAAYKDGALDGVRPDHVQFIQGLQPFNAAFSPAGAPPILRFLRQLSEQPSSVDVVTAWAHLARPEVVVEPPSVAEIVGVEPDGPITSTKTIATFQVTHPPELPRGDRPTVFGNPNVAFDLVSAVGSAPTGPDDTFSHRGRVVLATVTLILEAFERSMGLREGVVDNWDPAARLATAATGPLTWAPLLPHQERAVEAADAVHQSEVGIATISGGRELTLVVADDDKTYLRRVAAATALDPRLPQGTAAEEATATAAAFWGLPDFVFPPVKRETGSGSRELGDGIVLVGDQGLILQVKSRENLTQKTERETNWIKKQAARGAGQAVGTLRQLRRRPEVMSNQRGRLIAIDGNAATWIGVVIVDHPEPPDGLTLPVDHEGLPVVTLVRRDWEFLFEQLGSTAAVVAYLHRVAGDPGELGDEPARYYDLAGKDAIAPQNPVRNGWAAETGATWEARPILPRTPATTATGPGRAMFRMVLEDCSGTRIDNENARLTLLSFLDRTPVTHQAEVGDRLLQMLHKAKRTVMGGCSWDFRWIFDTQRPRQVVFGVSNQLSTWHNDAFRSRLLLQHHRITRHDWDPDDEPTTVGVLLTPNYYLRDRLWDTSVMATFGPSVLTPEDVEVYETFWERSR